MASFPLPLRHGPVTRVAEGVHCVRGTFRMGPGMMTGRTMTVLTSDDGLVVLNATRMDDAGQAELESLGPVAHLVKLSESHGIDEPWYEDRYQPTTWTLPDSKPDGIAPGNPLTGEGPVAGGEVIDFGATDGWREAAYWGPPRAVRSWPAMRCRIRRIRNLPRSAAS